jgi:hypothetical protein
MTSRSCFRWLTVSHQFVAGAGAQEDVQKSCWAIAHMDQSAMNRRSKKGD